MNKSSCTDHRIETSTPRAAALIGLPFLVLFGLVFGLLLFLVSCGSGSISEEERIANIETIRALTPSITNTPPPSDTPAPTNTATQTVGPTATPTRTPRPTNTPVPPTPTRNPALEGLSFCNQQVGPSDA
ncbi:MAG: hypothetical protein HC837_14805, partial [Chloroflexaceae bacterium]|nr:hypothetical protein [Chloroflexaceae bacterium]